MRWMLGILVVANLSIFIWGRTIGRIAVQENPAPPVDVGNMILLDSGTPGTAKGAERQALVPEPSKMAPTATVAEPADVSIALTPEKRPVAVRQCWKAGPFRDEEQAESVRRALLEKGAEASLNTLSKPGISGYWVLVPPAADTESAIRNEKALKSAGIDDIWRFRKGPLKNAISLGLYDRNKSADEWAEKIKTKGFEVEVRPKRRDIEEYWVSYALTADVEAASVVDQLVPGVDNERISCR